MSVASSSAGSSFASGNREVSQVIHYGLTTTRLERWTGNPTMVASPQLQGCPIAAPHERFDRFTLVPHRSLPDQPTPAHSPMPFGVSYVRDRNPSVPAGERAYSFQQSSPPHLGVAGFAYRQRSPTSPGLSFFPQPPPGCRQLSPSETEFSEMRGLLDEMSIEFDPSKISITQDCSDTSASEDSESFES